MTQTQAERIAALESLLPLLEAHLDYHGRTTAPARWESSYDPPPKGYVPPPPEPDCHAACPTCRDFQTRRCTLREERWAHEWAKLRGRYPQLTELEKMVGGMTYDRAHWAAALYWVYLEEWDVWNKARRCDWAKEAVAWLAKEFVGYLPTYVPPNLSATKKKTQYSRADVVRLFDEGLSYREIGRQLDISKSTVHYALKGRSGRTISAAG